MSQIELILKSPTDRIAPYAIKCNVVWTVKQLKEHIKEVYPSKPTVESQKVIYVGKLLKDDQILKNVFEPDSSTIVHFICQSSLSDAEKKESENLNKPEITPDKNPDLYKEYQNYINNYYASTSQSFNTMSPYHQMMWINQVYMQSYANYYAQFMNKSDNMREGSQPAINEAQISQSIPQEAVAQNQDNQPNNERGIEAANPAAVGENGMQNMMAAAFGGLMGDAGEDENDGEVEPRDILHYFYILVRFGLLLLICYYYSSVVSVVTTLMLFFVFFGVNLIRRNQNNHAQQAPPMAAAAVPSVVNEEEPGQPPEETGDQSPKPNVSDTLPNQSAAELSPVLVEPLPTITERIKRVATTSLQFVLTFFVTLFPEPIAHIDIN